MFRIITVNNVNYVKATDCAQFLTLNAREIAEVRVGRTLYLKAKTAIQLLKSYESPTMSARQIHEVVAFQKQIAVHELIAANK